MKQFGLFILLFFVTVAQAEQILSKSDAKRTFDTSLSKWVANLNYLQTNGMAQVQVVNDLEHTVIVNQPEWTLLVTPTYRQTNNTRPFKVTTSVRFPVGKSTLLPLSDQELKSVIGKWQKEMLPEYSVMTNIDVRDRIVMVTFTIFEVGTFPDLDEMAKNTSGCWKDCIRR